MLRETVRLLTSDGPPPTGVALPPLTGGLVGYLSYDIVRRFERLPELSTDDLHVPELGMVLATDLVVLDHFEGSAVLVANAILPPKATKAAASAAYHQAIGRLDAMTTALSRPTPPMVSTVENPGVGRFMSRTPEGLHPKAVEAAKEAIRDGECFQIVVAQRFERHTNADPLDIYRVLRSTNPSPYMYLLRFDGFDIVGSSPEAHLKVTGRRALLHPIAGTRWRGATPEEDTRLAGELLSDPKERAEHVMLVDLGRNDLGRVCKPGTVEVPEFATIERYSHVMHIVSTVVGELRDDQSAFDALVATYPAGTLTGAPKVRAMEIIDELEPTRRGAVRRHRRLLRVRRRHGHRDHDPDRAAARRHRLRPGRRRHRGRLRPRGRGAGDPQQGQRGARRHRRGRDAQAGPVSSPARTPTGRRALAVAVLLCAAGAGLALYAGSRTWLVQTVTRPAPLGPASTPRAGTELVPALAAVLLVVLAGAGALLATRGWSRRLVGGLILVGGLAAVGLAASALGRDGIAAGWVGVTVIGGVLAAGAGAFALIRGAAWPRLGARYERPKPAGGRPGADDRTGGSDQVASGSGETGDAISQEFWDALDRGDDPTKS